MNGTGLPLVLSALLWAAPMRAQDAPDPRAAMPERPTVATHAWTVAPGYLELESGFEWDRNPDGSHALSTPTVVKVGLAPRVQLGILATLNRPPAGELGVGDLAVAVKLRLADSLPVLGAVAVLPTLKLPLADQTHGTGTTDVSLLLISSHQIGPVSVDLNAGYTRRSGDGSRAPRNATVWTAAGAVPVAGAVGFTAELFGYPATSGPTGSPGIVALLGGPTFEITPSWIVDFGGIAGLTGPQPDAIYGGLVYNFGRL
jgi:hypothetical protein